MLYGILLIYAVGACQTQHAFNPAVGILVGCEGRQCRAVSGSVMGWALLSPLLQLLMRECLIGALTF